tara:strand:+ start:3443 stop:4726 length:1284 start_codon:yes stop_codon:yes gene_type:complete
MKIILSKQDLKIKSTYYFKTGLIFLLMTAVYFNVAKIFQYYGFELEMSIPKACVGIILIFLSSNLVLYKFNYDLKNSFIVYVHQFMFIPIIVLFSFGGIGIELLICHVIFLLSLKISMSLKLKKLKTTIFSNTYPIEKKQNRVVIYVLAMILLLPFISSFNNFSWSSFIQSELYAIRFSARQTESFLMGYFKAPLVRVLLPILFVYATTKRKYILMAIVGLIITLIYGSTGAVKSIIVVIPIILFFVSSKTYLQIQQRLFLIIFMFLSLSIFETAVIGSYFITDIPNRRLFFVPGFLENNYITEFKDNYLFYKTSYLDFLFSEKNVRVTQIIGGKYLGDYSINANVGVLMDGFINLGYIGVFIHASVVGLAIRALNNMKINPAFFGLFFVYFYYVNTSFLGTLLITHGLLFLIIASKFFLKDQYQEI